MSLRSFAFGGGVQSTAALVLAAQGRITFPLFIFANVGKDSENPATLTYVENYSRPYAANHGIELATIERIMARTGAPRTLYQHLTLTGSRSIDIPVRMANGSPGRRKCTDLYKIQLVAQELQRRGATDDNKAVVGVGISVDEIERANTRRAKPHERIEYPLLDLGLRRIDCVRIIHSAGLPIPPKSSCWFCPFHRPEAWHQMRRDEPNLFAKACDLEAQLNQRRTTLGKDPAWLTRFNKPLSQAIPDGVDLLPGSEDYDPAAGTCDSGYCFT